MGSWGSQTESTKTIERTCIRASLLKLFTRDRHEPAHGPDFVKSWAWFLQVEVCAIRPPWISHGSPSWFSEVCAVCLSRHDGASEPRRHFTIHLLNEKMYGGSGFVKLHEPPFSWFVPTQHKAVCLFWV